MPPGPTTRTILATPYGRIGNEENHQRHDGCVETVVGEGKRRRVAVAKFRHLRRRSCARKGELRLGRFYPSHLGWRAALDQQFGEGADPAAEGDPSQARERLQPVRKISPARPAQA